MLCTHLITRRSGGMLPQDDCSMCRVYREIMRYSLILEVGVISVVT